jgi:hypothetical protein
LQEDSYIVHQNFQVADHVAGRDINITSITLNLLETVVRQSKDIPEQEKKGILEHLQSLAVNPYVSGIASGAIFDQLKTFFTGGQ